MVKKEANTKDKPKLYQYLLNPDYFKVNSRHNDTLISVKHRMMHFITYFYSSCYSLKITIYLFNFKSMLTESMPKVKFEPGLY